MDKENPPRKRWEISVCPMGMVHVHYKTGSLDILKEGFLGLAREIRDVADQLEALSLAKGGQNGKGLHQ